MANSVAPIRRSRRRLMALEMFSRAIVRPPAAVGIENRHVREILVVELWNIGDVVLLLPFLAQLRAMFPESKVTLLARPHARIILQGSGLVDEFMDKGDAEGNWLSLNPLAGEWGELWRLRRRLKNRRFDLAFQCRAHVREHFILAMSRAKRRIGIAFGECDGLLTDAVEVKDPHGHKVDDWLRLLSVVGGPVQATPQSLCLSEPERLRARRFLERNGVSQTDIVVGIHPGASVPEKRWPLRRFAEVAKHLSSRDGVRVMAFVDPEGYGSSIGELDGVIPARVGLREMMALLQRCTVLVCNDSGPMHLAGALGVPTAAIFNEGIARWFAPLGESHELISSANLQSDEMTGSAGGLEAIPAEQVLSAVDRLIARKTRR